VATFFVVAICCCAFLPAAILSAAVGMLVKVTPAVSLLDCALTGLITAKLIAITAISRQPIILTGKRLLISILFSLFTYGDRKIHIIRRKAFFIIAGHIFQ